MPQPVAWTTLHGLSCRTRSPWALPLPLTPRRPWKWALPGAGASHLTPFLVPVPFKEAGKVNSSLGVPPPPQVAQPHPESICWPTAGPMRAVAAGPQARGWGGSWAHRHGGSCAQPRVPSCAFSAEPRGLFLEPWREPGLRPMAQGQGSTLQEPEDRVEGLGEDGVEGV